MTPDPKPTIGRIVHYHNRAPENVVAAIITMTPDAWVPGSRDSDGEWVPTTDAPQPKANTVHLTVFPPFGAKWTPEECQLRDVAYGETAGCWSWPLKV